MTLPLAKVASSWELSRWPLILLYFLSVHFCALAKLVFKQFVVSLSELFFLYFTILLFNIFHSGLMDRNV